MADPFRDNFEDPAVANRFGQHIGIAEDLLEEIARIPKYIEDLGKQDRADGTGLTQEVVDIWVRKWSDGWQNCWEQLTQARDLVEKRGRDVSGFDAARTAAGNIFIGAASGRAVRGLGEVHVTWQNVSTQTARDAIASLRAAMPEVVITKQAPLDVNLEPSGNKVVYFLAAAAPLLLIAYLIYRAIK